MCRHCHRRPAAGFTDGFAPSCKRCADAIYGIDDR